MKYTTLLFDSDDTMLDFFTAEYKALEKCFLEFNLPFNSQIHSLYNAANKEFWQAFERKEIKKQEIYVGRFKVFLERAKINFNPEILANKYENNLSLQFYTLPGAEELLKSLYQKYNLYVITNGNHKIQKSRLNGSGLMPYFKGVFTSEQVGSQKPQKSFFNFVLNNITEKNKSKILIIGDSLTSDILGGINSGIDTCWYNPQKQSTSLKPTYIVNSFSELKNLLQ